MWRKCCGKATERIYLYVQLNIEVDQLLPRFVWTYRLWVRRSLTFFCHDIFESRRHVCRLTQNTHWKISLSSKNTAKNETNTGTAQILIEYDLAFLAFPEFPPDPNRGFDLPSAMLSIEGSDVALYVDFERISHVHRNQTLHLTRNTHRAQLHGCNNCNGSAAWF